LLERNNALRLSRTPGMGNRFAFVAHTDKDPYNKPDLMMALSTVSTARNRRERVLGLRLRRQRPHRGHEDEVLRPQAKAQHLRPRQGQVPLRQGRCDLAHRAASLRRRILWRHRFGRDLPRVASKAGIKLDLKRVSGDGYWDNVWLKVPFCAVYWGNRPTIDNQLTSTFKANTTWNDTRFNNAEFERLLVGARVELDQAKRAQMYARCQELISQNSGMVCCGAGLPGRLQHQAAGPDHLGPLRPWVTSVSPKRAGSRKQRAAVCRAGPGRCPPRFLASGGGAHQVARLLRTSRCTGPKTNPTNENAMVKLIRNRLLLGVLTLFAVSILIFVCTEILPGDVASAVLGQGATPEALVIFRKELGLDVPAYLPLLELAGRRPAGRPGCCADQQAGHRR